ncbi:MAG: L-aspartate oxidase [Ornithinimicrobium sp.]
MNSGPVIVGAGLAGLMTAINLSPMPCTVLTSDELGAGAATGWAQGGIAAAFGADDSPALHAADTMAAGDGLCDAEIVNAITAAAPAAVEQLAALGADFDRAADGSLRVGLEGAHSHHRIVHAGGDGSGAEILRAVVEAAKATESVTVLEYTRAVRIVTASAAGGGTGGSVRSVTGVEIESDHEFRVLPTDAVVLATGGYGALWLHTSNPLGARGQGLAMAARAGALLRDLEMAQFHPTSLHAGLDPMPLISEAVRGEGAILIDGDGAPLPCDNLASRDIVSRAVWAELSAGGSVFLDARDAIGSKFSSVFPGIDAACQSVGIDPAIEPIPVHPAAHYQCGGVEVDRAGRSSVPGLWAVGEVASTGLHGANRLASNSLLEAVVCGGWVAEDITEFSSRGRPTENSGSTSSGDSQARPPAETEDSRMALRHLLTTSAGVVREAGPLTSAIEEVGVHLDSGGIGGLSDHELMALLICHSALTRQESRGGHLRSDFLDQAVIAEHTMISVADLSPRLRDSA